jgi:HSP20 family molecular chaperone IbpA
MSDQAPASSDASYVSSYLKKESVKMPKFQMKVAPDTVAYADAENHKLVVEFAIPGAPSNTIDAKILEDSVHLTAPARDIEYVAALALSWPVKPDKAEATYENGLLRIEVPFKDPMEDAVKVAIKTGGAETKTKTIVTGGELPAAARVSGKAPAGQQPKSPVTAPA